MKVLKMWLTIRNKIDKKKIYPSEGILSFSHIEYSRCWSVMCGEVW